MLSFDTRTEVLKTFFKFFAGGLEDKVRVEKNRLSSSRYGFNGQEKDDEISGAGNSNTAQFWQYDTRLGRRWNVDPVVKHRESGYATFGNNPIFYIDPNGDDWYENSKGELVELSQRGKVINYNGEVWKWKSEYRTNVYSLNINGGYSKKYKYWSIFGRGDVFPDYMWAGKAAEPKMSFDQGKEIIGTTIITVATMGVGELFLAGKAWYVYAGWEVGTRTAAVHGNIMEIDWFDAAINVLTRNQSKLVFKFAKDGVNSVSDLTMEEGFKVVFDGGKQDAGIDFTYAFFKTAVTSYVKSKGASEPTVSEMKQAFDLMKSKFTALAEENSKK